jgi:hypothetical protein
MLPHCIVFNIYYCYSMSRGALYVIMHTKIEWRNVKYAGFARETSFGWE